MLLTRSLVYCKRIQLGNSHTKEMHRARHGERAGGFVPSPGSPVWQNLRVLTNLDALLSLSSRVFMEALSHSHSQSLATGDWFNLQYLSHPCRCGWMCVYGGVSVGRGTTNWKFQHSNNRVVSWQPAATPRCFAKDTSFERQKTPLSVSTLGKFQGFQDLWVRNWGRPNTGLGKSRLIILINNNSTIINE